MRRKRFRFCYLLVLHKLRFVLLIRLILHLLVLTKQKDKIFIEKTKIMFDKLYFRFHRIMFSIVRILFLWSLINVHFVLVVVQVFLAILVLNLVQFDLTIRKIITVCCLRRKTKITSWLFVNVSVVRCFRNLVRNSSKSFSYDCFCSSISSCHRLRSFSYFALRSLLAYLNKNT